MANQVNLPTKVRSRRKMDLKKPQRQKDLKIPDKSLDDTSASFTALHDRAFSLKVGYAPLSMLQCFLVIRALVNLHTLHAGKDFQLPFQPSGTKMVYV